MRFHKRSNASASLAPGCPTSMAIPTAVSSVSMQTGNLQLSDTLQTLLEGVRFVLCSSNEGLEVNT